MTFEPSDGGETGLYLCAECGRMPASEILCPSCQAPRVIPISRRWRTDSLRSLLLTAVSQGVDYRPIVIGTFMAILAVPMIVVGLTLSYDGAGKGVVAIVLGLGVFLLHRGIAAWRGHPTRKLQSDARPPIIYFRSFGTDREPWWREAAALVASLHAHTPPMNEEMYSPEARIRSAIGRLGPLIALRSPKDVWPRIGAVRFKADAAQWKQVVKLALANSQAALFHFVDGEVSEATKWEWKQAFGYLPPERVFVLLSHDPNTLDFVLRARYDQLWQQLSIDRPPALRNAPAVFTSFVLCFDANYEPHISTPGYPRVESYGPADALCRALVTRGLLQELPPEKKDPSIGKYVLMLAIAALFWLGFFYLLS